MYKEYRDVSLNGAISQMCKNALYPDMEMSGNHKALPDNISVLRTATLTKNDEVKRNPTWNLRVGFHFIQKTVKFPVLKKTIRKSAKKYTSTFSATRPNLFA